YIAERDPAPDLRENQNHHQGYDNSNHTDEDRAKYFLGFTGHRVPPLVGVRLAVIEDDDFLAEREKRAGKLFETLGKFLEFLFFGLQWLRIGGRRLSR